MTGIVWVIIVGGVLCVAGCCVGLLEARGIMRPQAGSRATRKHSEPAPRKLGETRYFRNAYEAKRAGFTESIEHPHYDGPGYYS